MTSPRVSVVVPCLNERRFVERALRSLLDGDFPAAAMEVLVVDGGSSDGTRAIVAGLAALDARVQILDNPRGTTPAALNLGIAAARGEIVVRADAHTVYPRDYLRVLVRTLDETGADLVGCRADPAPAGDGWLARTIAVAASGGFATGSPFRSRERGGPVDTVPFGCWRRALFERVGLFDERLLRNQDNEHSSRILQSGGRVHLTTETRVAVVVRGSLGELWRHAVKSGEWNAFTQWLHPYTFRWRHFLPALFFLGVVVAALAIVAGALAGAPHLVAFGLIALAPYAAADALVALGKSIAERRLIAAVPVALITASYHFTYGYGIAKGWLLVATGGWRQRLGMTEART